MNEKRSERGAALVIVLLLVATLSFVLLSLTTIVTTGVRRGANERARTELLWRTLAAERIALSILRKAATGGALKSATDEGGLYSQQLALPIERGEAALRFADASRCFNVNSLIDADFDAVAAEHEAFVALLEAIGAGGNEAQSVADAVTDFLDRDNSTQSQGSEDNFYTGLATPFRTAGGPVAAVSELRSIEGITREIYARVSPFVCARAVGQKIDINVNALTPEDAPVVFAAAGGAWPLDDIKTQIAATPPGGWPAPGDFWAAAIPGGVPPPGVTPSDVSTWVEARVLLEADERFVEETLIVQTPATGEPRLYARVLGGGS